MVPCRQWIIYAYPQGPQIGPMAAQKCLHKPVDEAKDHKAMTTKVPQQETNREPEKEAVKISRWLADARTFIDKHWPHAEGLSHPGAYQKAAENWYHALAQQGLVDRALARQIWRRRLAEVTALPMADALPTSPDATDKHLGHVADCPCANRSG